MTVLVTGSNGFLGQAVVANLVRRTAVHAVVRDENVAVHETASRCAVGDIGTFNEWGPYLVGVEAVVHCAARVHVMNDTSGDALKAFRRVNVVGSSNLARAAAAHGVRRFVYISSIKVNGDSTDGRSPFNVSDKPLPEDAYGVSKWEAEQSLLAIAKETGMELVIIRPPMIYGKGVKGNFASLVRALERGIPLPLGAVENRRSLIALPNMVDLIDACLLNRKAAGHTFFASDDDDVSTTRLLREVGRALGKEARLLPVRSTLLWAAARAMGKTDKAVRLLGSLQVDLSQTKWVLNWKPPVSVGDALSLAFAPQSPADDEAST